MQRAVKSKASEGEEKKRVAVVKGRKMKKKIFGVALAVILFALCLPVEAQQAKKVHRIGFLVPGSPATFSARIEALRQGLRDLGYVEGGKGHHY